MTEGTNPSSKAAIAILQSYYWDCNKCATDYNRKVIEIACVNTNAALDYVLDVLGVKSAYELSELSRRLARKQLAAMTVQTTELTALAQRVLLESTSLLKTGISGANTKVS